MEDLMAYHNLLQSLCIGHLGCFPVIITIMMLQVISLYLNFMHLLNIFLKFLELELLCQKL
jgi:hypothetical protein